MGKEWNGLYTVERSRIKDAKVVRNRLIWVAYTATWDQVLSRPELWLRVISGSVVLPSWGL